MTDAERIRRLEVCVAYLSDLLTTSNPHIERELEEIWAMLTEEPEPTREAPNDG